MERALLAGIWRLRATPHPCMYETYEHTWNCIRLNGVSWGYNLPMGTYLLLASWDIQVRDHDGYSVYNRMETYSIEGWTGPLNFKRICHWGVITLCIQVTPPFITGWDPPCIAFIPPQKKWSKLSHALQKHGSTVQTVHSSQKLLPIQNPVLDVPGMAGMGPRMGVFRETSHYWQFERENSLTNFEDGPPLSK